MCELEAGGRGGRRRRLPPSTRQHRPFRRQHHRRALAHHHCDRRRPEAAAAAREKGHHFRASAKPGKTSSPLSTNHLLLLLLKPIPLDSPLSPPTPRKLPRRPGRSTLDAQLSSPNKSKKRSSSPPLARSPPRPPPPELAGFKPVKENSFIIRDRQERESKKACGDPVANGQWRRRDPLECYPERCPTGNGDGVVLYTTTLRSVRRTFEDCERARRAVEERDVSLHGEYLKEVRGELIGEGAAVPRLCIRGRYVGGVEEGRPGS